MKIKELQKTVNIAWSPHPQYPIFLAAGTAAGQLDSNANSVLEIYSTNFSDPSYDLELKASLPSQYRFQKIIWSPTGFDKIHRNGLIVGGCEGGHLMIYSAAKMLAGEEGIIARQDKHSGTIRGLDFNPFQTNLLASVASESEIFIWDLNNTATHMTPGSKTQPLEDVQNVAWNRQVQHILASVFSSRCVIWDLRKNEQIIKLSDTQSRVRWRAVQWHPEVATQIWLASEDDQAPVVQLWDLRYATSPAKTMQIHQRGVLGMSWCPRDTDLMVSCGKDNRIYCWNPNTDLNDGEILSEVAITSTWYSDVQWCPRNPALIASSSLDGNVSIYSLFGGTQQQVQTSNKIADSFPGMDQFAQAPVPRQSTKITYSDLKYAPKWMKKHRGTKFGFGGKLVSFNSKSKNVIIYQVTTEPELVERANALERSVNEANFIDYCRKRADQMPDQNGRYLWYFLKANFELNPKEEMLNLLGFNKDDIDQKFAKYVKIENENDANLDQITNRISALTHGGEKSATFDGKTSESDNKTIESQSTKLFKILTGEDSNSLIAEAILTGNLEAAIELCMKSQRPAEAFIIASTAGIDCLTKIQNRYLKAQSNELSNIISALVTRDWMTFICQCTLDSWKEALMAALKHSDKKFINICEKLGDRLLNENPNLQYTQNAILLYICSGNIEKLVEAWYQLKKFEKNDVNYKLNVIELQELSEIIMLLGKSLEQQGIALEPEGKFADFISEYGDLLAGQGALSAALTYIFSLGPTDHPRLDELRDRIYKSVNAKKDEGTENSYGKENAKPLAQTIPNNPFQNQNENFNPISQFNNNSSWNSTPISGPAILHPTVPQQQQQQQQQQPPPLPPVSMFTPSPLASQPQQQQINPISNIPLPQQKSPFNDNNLTQPPRPSSVNSQGSNSSHMPRNKYVVDPSVASSGTAMGGYGSTMPFNQSPMDSGYGGGQFYNQPVAPPPLFNTNLPSSGSGGIGNSSSIMNSSQSQPAMLIPSSMTVTPIQQTPSSFTQPLQSSDPFNQYGPLMTGMEAAQHAMFANMQKNPTPPPGWNDPPTLKSIRQKPAKQQEPLPQTAAITHPLFGYDISQNQSQNGYQDSSQYQNQVLQSQTQPLMPPLGNINNQRSPSVGIFNPAAQNNNQQEQVPPQMNFQTSAVPQQQSGQQWNANVIDQTRQQQQQQQQQQQTKQMQLEPLKEKPPIPEEFIYMQTVFEELKKQCLTVASDPRTKRKFVDVAKRLENLYDCLREGRLTSSTTSSLNQMVQSIQIGDYSNALATHTKIAFGSDFSQTAGFMPGIKALVQLASDLKIFLR